MFELLARLALGLGFVAVAICVLLAVLVWSGVDVFASINLLASVLGS